MSLEGEQELLEKLRVRGVDVRGVAELPFRRPERYAQALPLLVERLRATEDSQWIAVLTLALGHPELRSALPALLDRLGRVPPSAEIDVANAVRKMGVRGSEPAVLDAIARARSGVARDALRRALRKAGYRGPEVAPDDRWSPLGRKVFLAGAVGLAALLSWGAVDLLLKGGHLVPLPALAFVYAASTVALGIGVWRLMHWATAAYVAWALVGVCCQIAVQDLLGILPPEVFWYAEAGTVVVLVIAGLWLDRILRQTRTARETFERALARLPDEEPEDYDAL